MRTPIALAWMLLALACSDEANDSLSGPSAGAAGQGTGGSAGSPDTGGSAGSVGSTAGSGGAAPGDGHVRIHIVASTEPFAHDDGLSGQTPLDHLSGIRSYRLFRDASDTTGAVVFDLGDGFVEASYNDKADTVVADVPLKNIPEGTYTRAQVVHTHVRYTVKATAHSGTLDAPGQLTNLHVMSKNTTLDGVLHQSGHYEATFTSSGVSFPSKGENGPVPEKLLAGGLSVKLLDGQWTYEFPVNFVIDHSLQGAFDSSMHLNMFESFRWKDETQPGYAPAVFDLTAASFEPVVQFGANSFTIETK